ncbi:MAG: hypothetical protein WCF65_04540 [Parachlamydiaceae bacterium]
MPSVPSNLPLVGRVEPPAEGALPVHSQDGNLAGRTAGPIPVTPPVPISVPDPTGADSPAALAPERVTKGPLVRQLTYPPTTASAVEKECRSVRRQLGCQAVLQLKAEGKLKIGSRQQEIPIESYQKFVEKGDVDDIKNIYKSMKQLSFFLDDTIKKHIETIKRDKSATVINGALQTLFDAKLSLNHHKELLFNERYKLLNQENKDLLQGLQELVGQDTLIPIDYKLSLTELLLLPKIGEEREIQKKTTKTVRDYLHVAAMVKKSIVERPEVSPKNLSPTEINHPTRLHPFFAENLENLAVNGFVENFDDDSCRFLTSSFNLLNIWLLAKVGEHYNTQLVTDAIDLALPPVVSLTDSIHFSSESLRMQEGMSSEQMMAPYLPPSEQRLASEGCVASDTYSCRFKNEWNCVRDDAGLKIEWKGLFAVRTTDDSFREKQCTGTIDLSHMKGLTPKTEEVALRFIAAYCRTSLEERGKLANQGNNVSSIAAKYRSVFNHDADFWKWIDKESPIDDPMSRTYVTQLEQTQNNFDQLLAASRSFANDIDHAMVNIFVDRTQDLTSLKDQSIMDTGFEVLPPDSEVSDEEDGKISNPVSPVTPASAYQDISARLSVFGSHALSSASTALKSVAAAASGLISKAFESPAWVTAKYNLALSIIGNELRTTDELGNTVDYIQSLESVEPQSSLSEPLKAIFDAIEAKNGEAGYQIFLQNLRSALNSDYFKDELEKKKSKASYDLLVDVFLEICRVRFEEGHIYTFCDDLIKKLLPESQGTLDESDFKTIEMAPPSEKISRVEVNAKKLQGHLNVNFDPHLQGNIPFVLGEVEINGKPVKLLRMGTPTMEYGFGATAEIIPEFRGYVEGLALQGQKHLYISLQNDKQKLFYAGDESGRNSAIKELHHDYPDTFFAVVLAQDSRFYKQVDSKGAPLAVEDSNLFKRKFFNELTGENTGFYFPKTWTEDPDFQFGLHQLLEAVHHIAYEDKADLSAQEKKDFIEIYYSYLSIFLMEYSKADNANITCKDAIDRAGKLNSLVLKLIMMIQRKDEIPENKRIHQVYTHAPAFLVKSQAIIHSRRDRLLTALATMENQEVAERIRENRLTSIAAESPTSIVSINPQGTIKIPGS